MKVLLAVIIVYFVLKRIGRITRAVSNDPRRRPSKKPDDKHGGEYVDYEEID